MLIDFIQRDDGSWFLRVTDKGIGMTADTLKNYFLRAGASFRQSADWAREFLDDEGKPRVLCAGRFGIGAFATFLLGPEFRLRTRHVSAQTDQGYELEVCADSSSVEIRRCLKESIGTDIEVEISPESIKAFSWQKRHGLFLGKMSDTDWFCWDWPRVLGRVNGKPLIQRYKSLLSQRLYGPEWSAIDVTGFDAVYWSFANASDFACNGIAIRHPDALKSVEIGWPDSMPFNPPKIAVADSLGKLRLTIQRYELINKVVPFIEELRRDVLLSFIAYALTCGPTSVVNAAFPISRYPLSDRAIYYFNYSVFGNTNDRPIIHWCATEHHFVMADPWLFTKIGMDSYVILGYLDPGAGKLESKLLGCLPICIGGMPPVFGLVGSILIDPDEMTDDFQSEVCSILKEIVEKDHFNLGGKLISAKTVVSMEKKFTENISKSSACSFQVNNLTSNSRARLTREFGTEHKWSVDTDALLAVLDSNLPEKKKKSPVVAPFVAEIHFSPTLEEPVSHLAKIWNECLGPTAIPFDPAARQALIEKGRQHPELKRHIEAWEELKRSGSEWANYRGE